MLRVVFSDTRDLRILFLECVGGIEIQTKDDADLQGKTTGWASGQNSYQLSKFVRKRAEQSELAVYRYHVESIEVTRRSACMMGGMGPCS